MNEELIEFKNKMWLQLGAIDRESIQDISKVILDEKISSLLKADEKMCDSMIDYAKQASLEGVETRDLAIQKWQETHWHKIIKIEIDNLRKLKEELEEIK